MHAIVGAAAGPLVWSYISEWVRTILSMSRPSSVLHSGQICLHKSSVQRNARTSWACQEVWWMSDQFGSSNYRRKRQRTESFLTVTCSARSFSSTVTKIYCDTSSITQSTPRLCSSFLCLALTRPSVHCHVEWATARDDCAVIPCVRVLRSSEFWEFPSVQKQTTDPLICTLTAEKHLLNPSPW